MKIYMVTANNGMSYEDYSWWNVGAFYSEEAALRYISEREAEIRRANAQLGYLERLEMKRELTADEAKEYRDLYRAYEELIYADEHGGAYGIEEIDILG